MENDPQHSETIAAQTLEEHFPSDHLSGHSPAARKNFRWNFSMGVLNGILVQTGEAFLHPAYVLSVLMFQLTGLKSFAGLIMCLDVCAWTWPQLWVSHKMEGNPIMMPGYRKAMIVRAVSYFGLICAIFSLHWGGGWFRVFLILLFLFGHRTGQGFSGIPFFELVCKTVPPNWRGRYFGIRQIIGGSLATLCGMLVHTLMKLPYPNNFLFVISCGAVGFVLGPFLFQFIREPRGDDRAPRSPSFRSHLQRAIQIYHTDIAFRKLVAYTAFFSMATWAQGLFGIYCIEEMGVPQEFMGKLVALDMAVLVVSNILWTYLSDRHGNLSVLKIATPMVFLAPVGFLIATFLGRSALWLVLVSISLSGFASTAYVMGWLNMLLEIAPGKTRPSYLGFMNLLRVPMSLCPMLAGIAADRFSYSLVFTVAAVSGLFLFWALRGIPEPRHHARNQ